MKQDFLNHLRKMERDLAIQSARATVPVLMEHLKADAAEQTHRVAQILRIGKHELELLLDRNATGVTLEEPHRDFRAVLPIIFGATLKSDPFFQCRVGTSPDPKSL